MKLSEIEETLNDRFSNISRLGDNKSIFRCERTDGDRLLSIFYFDASGMLAREGFDHARYQEDILSEDFYANAGPLQWSYYLVFLLERDLFETPAVREFSTTVVRDDYFARKYVVPEDELEGFVDRALYVNSNLTTSVGNIVDGWLSSLEPFGLSDIGRTPRTKLIARIKNGEAAPCPQKTGISSPVRGESLTGIKSLSVDAYRGRQLGGTYPLKRVNLLSGPNGSGKTSFLEAIELILCGQTEASGEEEATLSLETCEGKLQRYEQGNGSKYRDRDAMWFGRSYVRGNSLPKSFGRYVFFSSDAAYKLAYEDTAEDLNKAFKDLLLGGEATKVFDRIHGLAKELNREEQQLASSLEQGDKELSECRAEVIRIEGELSQTDNLANAQNNVTRALGLAVDLSPTDALHALSTAKRHLVHAKRSVYRLRPLTIENLAAERDRLKAVAAEIATRQDSADSARALAGQLNSSFQTLGRDLKLVESAEEILKILTGTSVGQVMAVKKELLSLQERRSGLLRAKDRLASSSKHSGLERKKLVDIVAQIDEAEQELLRLKEQISGLKQTISELAKLRRELANMGARILDVLPEEGNCPLCGEHHGRETLERKISDHEVEDPAERLLATSSKRLRLLEKEIKMLSDAREATHLALAFLNANVEADGGGGIALSEIMVRLEGEFTQCGTMLKELDPVLQKATALEQIGYEPGQVANILANLASLAEREGLDIENGKLDEIQSQLLMRLAKVSEALSVANKESKAAEMALQEAAVEVFSGLLDPKNVHDEALSQIRAIDAAADQLEAAKKIITFDTSHDVTDLENRVEAHLEELRSALDFHTRLEENSTTLRKYRAEIKEVVRENGANQSA